MSDLTAQRDWIARLVAFDTTSRNSNLPLIDDVETYLQSQGARTARVLNSEGTKANLYASVGPDVPGGVILSGHTDVVPVDGQDWRTDPFRVVEQDGRLYGRGVADMKSFPAIALSLVPEMDALKRPIHFALSYDEEVGLLGAPSMIAEMATHLPPVSACIVGEPTDMKIVDAHKGICVFETRVRGLESHSSQTDRGVSAVAMAARLMAYLAEETAQRAEGINDERFTPAFTTATPNLVHGGTASNIMARDCVFVWDLRVLPGDDSAGFITDFNAFASELEGEMQRIGPDCSITTKQLADGPALTAHNENAARDLAMALTGANATYAVPYAAEAGQFQEAGFQTVICGPGSINQAHQPNEFIELDQVDQCTTFLRKLIARMSAD